MLPVVTFSVSALSRGATPWGPSVRRLDPRPVPAAFRLRLRADGSVGLPYQPSTGPGTLTLTDLRGRVLGRAGYDGSAWDASGLGRVGEGVVRGPRVRQAVASGCAGMAPMVDYLCAALDLEF